MKSRLVMLSLLLVIAFCGTTYCSAYEEKNVSIVAKLSNTYVDVGKCLVVNLIFINNTEKQYTFCANNINHNKLFGRFFRGEKNFPYTRRKPGEYLPRMTPFKDDFFCLKPNSRKTLTYSFKVERGPKVLDNWLYVGNFLNYNDEYYVCMGFDRVASFSVEYKITDRERQFGEKLYKAKNLYSGVIKSNTVSFRIR